MELTKQIRLNAFNMNCVGHIHHGMWKHPRDNSVDYTKPEYWIELAQLLERGLFDAVFLADIIGVYDVLGDGIRVTAKEAVQLPVNDPSYVVPLMAHATKHLSFGITANLTYEHPYLFARRFATLDHLTNGRVGWNIVTGYLDSAARGVGLKQQIDHDDRYDRGDDFMDAFYKLLEGSWEDDAVRKDREGAVYADPAKIHRVNHDGPFYKIDNVYNLTEPSPQRTPVLFQAGASQRGNRFAGRHAECVFTGGPDRAALAKVVSSIRGQAVEAGRNRDDIKVFSGLTVITDRSEAVARDKLEEYKRYASAEGSLAHQVSGMGVDLELFGLDEEITEAKLEGLYPNRLQRVGEARGRRFPEGSTRRKLLEQRAFGAYQSAIVGTPSQVADEIQKLVEETDLDGFNVTRTVAPESYRDFIDLIIPELQERGLYKTAYEEGTLREKLFGAGARLPSNHHADRYRTWK
ncbi:FMN-dependent oxidoreductase (nitrilotriacetate monooxygenase family) [Pseudoduganella lurida]|uniref:FMN-dependent oxidoreductase (Nitrilotriacetate monooxygenase family) n=1 Tax=Pseudoduganella lurida TaxID=1036180 RepID=A0A562RE32_9BURK|nr:LLM class flavin-dependent oxidoreductase [Pseudoduganella lurida]TWI67347.1 FMN-dependent oxidoreductase (nitrilotriacetate monooxygenase family) [Pseudoduganella lurida]